MRSSLSCQLQKPPKIWVIFLLFCATLLALMGATATHAQQKQPLSMCDTFHNPPMETRRVLTIGNAKKSVKVNIEVALTMEERARGLMCRTDLTDTNGMMFFFSPPQVISMWMKNTPLSLDMVFIAQSGDIIKIVENTTPYSEDFISSELEGMFTLEMKAGFVKRTGLKVGDRMLSVEAVDGAK